MIRKLTNLWLLTFGLVTSRVSDAKVNPQPEENNAAASPLMTFTYGLTPTITPYDESGNLSITICRQRLLKHLTHITNRQQNTHILPAQVRVKLFPIKIQDLNEKSEVLETTIRLQVSWIDSRLAWKPSMFKQVSEMVIPGNAIWSPDIGILNSVSDIYHVIRDTRFEMKVESNGRVWWHPTGIIKTYCKLQLRYFPFDRQSCKIVLESPTLDIRFMNLTLRSVEEPTDNVMYLGGETWNLLSVTGANIQNKISYKTIFTRVEFSFHIQRARIYHLLNVILPAIFLSLVQVMFFLLPPTHPQRVGSSTTTLLSVVVFHSVAVSQLPRTSTEVPILAYYIFIVTFISGLSVCASIFVAKFAVYADQNHQLPVWLSRIRRPGFLSRRNAKKKAEEATPCLQVVVHTASGDIANCETSSKLIETDPTKPCAAVIGENLTKRESSSDYYLFTSWHDVSDFADMALMIFVLALATVSPFVLFVVFPRFLDNLPAI